MAKTKITTTKTNQDKKARVANAGVRGFNLLDEEDMKELLKNNISRDTLEKED